MTSYPVPTLQTVLVSEHAAQQYQHRLKPALDVAAARAELERLLPAGQITNEPPEWVRSAGRSPYYVIVSDALALPLRPQDGGWIATTCVTQTTLTDDRRTERAHLKARRASRKRAGRRSRF